MGLLCLPQKVWYNKIMETISGGPKPTFNADEVLKAVNLNQATRNWVATEVPPDSDGNVGDVVFIPGGPGGGSSLGAWTPYTPTLIGWTLGNGTVSGTYCQIGKVVHFQITLTVGSTTAIGSSPTFTVPVTMKSTTAWNVRGYFRDVSGGGTYDLAARPASTSTIGGFYIGTNGQHLSFNATTPFTWASGDSVNLSGTYEAA